MCRVDEDKTVAGDETVSYTVSLEPQPDGSLRGLLVCDRRIQRVRRRRNGSTISIHRDPSRRRAARSRRSRSINGERAAGAPAAPVAGPVLDGTYRLDLDALNTTYSDGSRNPSTANGSRWFAFRSICTAAGCAATEAHSTTPIIKNPLALAGVFHFTDGHWVDNGHTKRIPCDPNRRGATTAEHTVTLTWDLVPQPDGTLRGVNTITFKSNECGKRGVVMTTPVVATRTGPVSPNVVLADPALFV